MDNRIFTDGDAQEVIKWVNESFTDVEGGFPLYDIQKEALTRLLEILHCGGEIRGVLQMPTGTGKTVVAIALIKALYYIGRLRRGDIVLYLTPRVILKGQVEERMKDFLINNPKFQSETGLSYCYFRVDRPQENVIKNLGFYFEKMEYDDRVLVLVATPNALHEYLKNVEEAGGEVKTIPNIKKVKVVVMDEVHTVYFGKMISESIRKFLKDISKDAIVVGLSATPIKQAIEEIGYLLYCLPSSEAMDQGILVGKLKIYRKKTETKLRHSSKDPWKVAVIDRAEKFSEEIIRILSEEARKLYPGEVDPLTKRIPKTLVVAVNIVEATDIASSLKERIKRLREDDYRDEFVRVAHYKIKEAVREIEEFRMSDEGILVTVNMADIGFDDRDLEVLVIARPIRTPIAYVQIRGRVLRRPERLDENIKAKLGYAVLIDLTGASQHEESVDEVEFGELLIEDLDEVKRDLEGEGEVESVRGEVHIKDYGIIEVPQKPIDPRSESNIEKEILNILKLPYGLASKRIWEELRKSGCNLKIVDIERVCRKLFREGILERKYDTWFYPYKCRVLNTIRQTSDKDRLTIEELVKEARLRDRQQLRIILHEIIKEKIESLATFLDAYTLSEMLKIDVKDLIEIIPSEILNMMKMVTLITADGEKHLTLLELENLLRERKTSNDSLTIEFPIMFKDKIYSMLVDTRILDKFFILEEVLDEKICKVSLKSLSACLAIVKGCGYKMICNTLSEVLEYLGSIIRSGCREIEILTSYQQIAERIISILRLPLILLDLTPELHKFKIEHHYDSNNNKITIRLIRAS